MMTREGLCLTIVISSGAWHEQGHARINLALTKQESGVILLSRFGFIVILRAALALASRRATHNRKCRSAPVVCPMPMPTKRVLIQFPAATPIPASSSLVRDFAPPA